MGIPGLWETIGDGQVTSLAALSTAHYQQHKRPYRIAVDEAGWRFHNLNDAQVAVIKAREPAANPVEKAIFYRVSKLLRLNFQLIFVFDGAGRPWKRGMHGGNKVDYDRTKLLVQLLDRLGVPHHRAPGEAEAECAKMQAEGIVDAVWSDDSDTLMFGATTPIQDYREPESPSRKGEPGSRNHKSGIKKSDTHVRIYRAGRDLQGLDRACLVLFALLCGGDYDTAGLKGFGPVQTMEAIRWQDGVLAKLLCNMPLAEKARDQHLHLAAFRTSLSTFMKETGKRIDWLPPADWPRHLVIKNYRCPKVSSSEQIHSLNGLRKGWDVAIDEEKLRILLRQRFNIWTRKYIEHVLPFLLTQRLRRQQDHAALEINVYPAKKHDSELETRVTFLPTHVTTLDINEPLEEDWTILTKNDKGWNMYIEKRRAVANVLDCLLESESGLGADAMRALQEEAAQKPSIQSKSKRKQAATMSVVSPVDETGEAQTAKKKSRRKSPMPEDDQSITRPAKKRKTPACRKGEHVARPVKKRTTTAKPIEHSVAAGPVVVETAKASSGTSSGFRISRAFDLLDESWLRPKGSHVARLGDRPQGSPPDCLSSPPHVNRKCHTSQFIDLDSDIEDVVPPATPPTLDASAKLHASVKLHAVKILNSEPPDRRQIAEARLRGFQSQSGGKAIEEVASSMQESKGPTQLEPTRMLRQCSSAARMEVVDLTDD